MDISAVGTSLGFVQPAGTVGRTAAVVPATAVAFTGIPSISQPKVPIAGSVFSALVSQLSDVQSILNRIVSPASSLDGGTVAGQLSSQGAALRAVGDNVKGIADYLAGTDDGRRLSVVATLVAAAATGIEGASADPPGLATVVRAASADTFTAIRLLSGYAVNGQAAEGTIDGGDQLLSLVRGLSSLFGLFSG